MARRTQYTPGMYEYGGRRRTGEGREHVGIARKIYWAGSQLQIWHICKH